MYSLFDSQYLWNQMTCSYNYCAVVYWSKYIFLDPWDQQTINMQTTVQRVYFRIIPFFISRHSHTSKFSPSIYLFIPVSATWSIRQPWNMFFHFSFLTSDSLDRGSARRQIATCTQTQNKHRNPCLEWDSNPRSQCSSGWRHFMT
jgi:hypothetical protein